MLKMSRILYCLDLFGFSNIPITYKDKQSLRIKSSRFSFHNITNEDLLKTIESKLKELYKDTRVVNLYLIEFNYGTNFRYFSIEFESELFKNDDAIFSYPYRYSEKTHNKFRMLFEEMNELNCTSYYMTDIYINHSVESFIDAHDLLNAIRKN